MGTESWVMRLIICSSLVSTCSGEVPFSRGWWSSSSSFWVTFLEVDSSFTLGLIYGELGGAPICSSESRSIVDIKGIRLLMPLSWRWIGPMVEVKC